MQYVFNMNASNGAGMNNDVASPKNSSGSSRSFFTYTVVALGLALFIRFFIAAPYVVQGRFHGADLP